MAVHKVRVKGHGKVTVTGLKQTARDVRKVAALQGPNGAETGKTAAGDLALRLREAAEVVANIARSNAAEFSDRIPATVRVMGGTSRVYIRAGGPAGPAAYTAETAARHPVFGNRSVWRQGPVHPFLGPACDEGAVPFAVIVGQVLSDWAREIGFR